MPQQETLLWEAYTHQQTNNPDQDLQGGFFAKFWQEYEELIKESKKSGNQRTQLPVLAEQEILKQNLAQPVSLDEVYQSHFQSLNKTIEFTEFIPKAHTDSVADQFAEKNSINSMFIVFFAGLAVIALGFYQQAHQVGSGPVMLLAGVLVSGWSFTLGIMQERKKAERNKLHPTNYQIKFEPDHIFVQLKYQSATYQYDAFYSTIGKPKTTYQGLIINGQFEQLRWRNPERWSFNHLFLIPKNIENYWYYNSFLNAMAQFNEEQNQLNAKP